MKSISIWIEHLPITTIILSLGAVFGLVILLTGLVLYRNGAPGPAYDAALDAAPSARERELGPIKVGEIESDILALSYLDETNLTRIVQYPGASYIKIHFSKLDLMPGDTVSVADPEGTQLYTYPGSLYTTDEEDGFWAISILGDTAVIQLHTGEQQDSSIPPQHEEYYQRALAGASLKELGGQIDKYARGYPEEQIQSLLYGTESTCGSNQRTDVVCYDNSHPTEFERSHAVARLLKSGMWLCTGWRASDQNRVFTNEHCVTDQTEVSATEVRFNYQRLACGSGATATTTVVTGDTFLTDNYNYDFALFTVNNFESIASFGYLDIDPRTPVLDEEIYIPQHGNGNPKEFGIESDMNTGYVCRIDDAIANGRSTNSDTGYYCDTIGGSSGSPVLARSNHQVIAIHHFGISGSTCTSSDMNQGVRMDLIWPLVEQYFSSPPDVGPLVYDNHTIDDDNSGDSSGNGDGTPNCGENIELFVDLLNQGTDTATGVSASISTSDPYVTWLQNTSSNYPDITGSGTGTNTDDYDLSLASNTPDGHIITFNLDITGSNGGPWSDSFDVTATCDPPSAPTLLEASPVSSTQVDLAWQDNASDETAYHIERSPDGSTGWTEIDTVATNETSYSDSVLDCGVDYYYRVRAFRSGDGQYSDYSNIANATTYNCRTLGIVPGWNLITLPLTAINPYQAQSLLDSINNQGGACSEIDRWLNGGWEAHIGGELFNDFDISTGDGYFIKCTQNSDWTLEGSALTSSVTLNLDAGWNLVGVPYPESGYQGQSLLDDINAQGGVCSEIDRWLNGGWDAHVDGLPFNDFSIVSDQGYFIKCSGASSFSPSQQGSQSETSWPEPVAPMSLTPVQYPDTLEHWVTNRRDVSLSIAWRTNLPATGWVEYGPTPALGHTAFGEFGQDYVSRLHQVTLSGLLPGSTYYYRIHTGSSVFDEDGQPFQANTEQTGVLSSPWGSFGRVNYTYGRPATGALVLGQLLDGDGKVITNPYADIVDGWGYWEINLPLENCTGLTLRLDVYGPSGQYELLSLPACQSLAVPTLILALDSAFRVYLPFTTR